MRKNLVGEKLQRGDEENRPIQLIPAVKCKKRRVERRKISGEQQFQRRRKLKKVVAMLHCIQNYQ